MNKVLTKYIFLAAALLLISSTAIAQREAGNEGGTNATTEHVIVGGNVFGGGKLAPVAGNTEVIINQRGATVDSSIYGGGALANVGTNNTNTTRVLLLDGIINGNVYGGGLGDSIGNGYFGESNVAALVLGKVFVEVGLAPDNPNNPNTNGQPYGNITINGDVFGCNNINGTPKDDVRVNIYRTAHDGNNKYPKDQNGNITVTLEQLDTDSYGSSYDQKFAINAVYGGGNRASYLPTQVATGATLHNTTVYVWGCTENTVKTVYGGGNAADVGTSTNIVNTNIIIDGGRFDRVFGGGNGYSADHNHDKPYKDGDDCTATPTTAPCEDYNPGANISGTASTSIFGGLARQVFGASNQYGNLNGVSLYIENNCDTLLVFETFGGGNEADITGNLTTTLGCSDYMIGTFYGGSNLADVNGDVTLNVEGGNYINVFGGSKGRLANTSVTPEITEKAANINGTVTLNLHGGNIVNAFGGNDVKGRISGLITVNLLQQGGCGLQVDTIYGGGRDAEYAPDSISGKKMIAPLVNLLHGTVGHHEGQNIVHGCVFGGGKGTTAVVKAHPKVTIGDTITTGPDANVHQNYKVIVLGSVFGGGNAAEVDGIDSVLMVKANNEVVNLFGGGNKAVADTAVVIMTAGTVDTIFGGGNLAGLYGPALVNVSDGLVQKGIYGGCNKSGNVDDDITVNLNGGTVGATGTGNEANVHGGGYGSGTSTSSNVEVNIAQTGATSGPTIHGDVYGGSADGSVNSDEESSTNHTWVTLNAGTVNGSVYGGGLGITNNDCNVYGDVKVTVIGGSINTTSNTNVTSGSVFGCNNKKGAPQKTVEVIIEESTATGAPNMTVTNVYGGGNLAPCSVSPTVYINNGTVGGSVFGGGLGSSATVTGNPYVTVGDMTTAHASYQAIVTDDVFGGGDLAAVNGTTTVLVQKCNSSTITNVYGGGNAANVTNAQVYVTGGVIDTIFGGGHGTSSIAANVLGYDTISISGGNIREVFAGCNLQGSVSDTMQINIDKTNAPEDCDLFIGEVYGGGNKAAGKAGYITIGCTGDIVDGHVANPGNIGSSPLEGIGTVYGGANAADISNNIVVDIHSGMINKVFGGNNNSGVISGTIQVNIDSTGACNPNWYVGEVYGGGDHAPYNGTPDVNIIKGTVYRNVFGGGNDITLDTPDNPSLGVGGSDVEMTGGNVLLGVYGGCNLKGTVIGKSLVNITGGTVGKQSQLNVGTVAQVFGGGLGKDTRVKGDVEVNFGNLPAAYPNHPTTPSAYPKLYGDIYGGSAFGNVNTSNSNTTIVNILDGHLYTVPETHPIPGTSLTYTEYHGGNVYGGCLGQKADVNGPTDIFAKVFGKVTVNIGALDDTRTLDPANDTLFGNAIIEGNVYGCNNTNGSPQDDVTVNVCRTYRSETDQFNYEGETPTYAIPNVFGGGNEADYMLQGKTLTVHIYNCFNTVRRVFGGGNAASGPNVHTIIDGGRFKEVFGGGNGERGQAYAADVTGGVNLEIHGGYVDEFFVGSNQFGTITGTATVTVDQNSGCEEIDINEFFCGGKYADFIGNIEATISCSEGMSVSNLYGGCKEANVVKYPDPETTPNLSPELQALLTQHPELIGTGGNVHLTVWGGTYDNIYGGSKGTETLGADIEGNVTLDIYGGTINNAIYGGCNIKGLVAGNITVTVIDSLADGCELDAALCDVYGGGNLAEYVAPTGNGAREFNPIVDIRHAKVRNVFGGGKGDPEDNTQMRGSVIGTPKVTIGDDYDPHRAVVNESVYGGGNAAKIIGSPWVVLKSLSKVMGNVYGGGNMGVVDGDTKVIVNGKVVE